MDLSQILTVPGAILANLPALWTFFLLFVRFTAFMLLVPGLGMGERGMLVRIPAILVLSMASMYSSPGAALPTDAVWMVAGFASEILLGSAMGLIPKMIVAMVQTGVQLASTTMGLGMGNLIDPTLGVQVSDVTRIVGDLCILTFLMLGGHHVLVYAASGMGGQIVPGSFIVTDFTMDLLVNRSAEILRFGVILSAPVVVALLLTNFVLGLITKAVPTVNIFIVSFPLTIGIGLILTGLALPDLTLEFKRQVIGIENQVLELTRDATLVTPPAP